MRRNHAPLLRATLVLLISSAACPALFAQDGPKPLLSAEIGGVLEADGSMAAERRFHEIYPSQADGFEIDMQGMVMLASARAQANDLEGAQALFEMIMTLQQDQMNQQMPGMAAAAAAQQEEREEARRLEAAEAEEKRERSTRTSLGPPVENASSLAGVFGDPALQDQPAPKNFWVMNTCDGYLVVAPSWADTSPWHMKSVGDASFEHESQWQSFSMELEVDASGSPVALTHDIADLGIPARLEFIERLSDFDCMAVERGGR